MADIRLKGSFCYAGMRISFSLISHSQTPVMRRFAAALAGGEKHYPFAFRDSFMAMEMTRLAGADSSAEIDTLAWN